MPEVNLQFNTMKYKILLTGISRGLGYEMARILLEQGHQVFAIIRKEKRESDDLRKQYSDRLHLFKGDLSDEQKIINAIHLISKETGELDIIINNAGVHLEQDAPGIEEVDFSVYLPTFQVNSIAPLMIVKEALGLLRKGKTKLIVNISSEAGSIGGAWRSTEYSYCMSKAALNMGSRLLQNLLNPEGIRVLALHPGWFSSDMGGEKAPKKPEEAATELINTILHRKNTQDHIFLSPEGEKMDW